MSIHCYGLRCVGVVALAWVLLAGCGGAEPTGDERKRVLAPVDDAQLLVDASGPPVYAVRITSGLPSGCARFDEIEVERDDAGFVVTVWNTMPADDDVACTMIYGTAVNTVELEGDLVPGRDYSVRINDTTRLRIPGVPGDE